MQLDIDGMLLVACWQLISVRPRPVRLHTPPLVSGTNLLAHHERLHRWAL
jgi:hypothetical protein